MSPKIEAAIELLVESLRAESHPNATSFKLFVNCSEVSFVLRMRTAEDLKRDGISMRNLRGDFIKPNAEFRRTDPPSK